MSHGFAHDYSVGVGEYLHQRSILLYPVLQENKEQELNINVRFTFFLTCDVQSVSAVPFSDFLLPCKMPWRYECLDFHRLSTTLSLPLQLELVSHLVAATFSLHLDISHNPQPAKA